MKTFISYCHDDEAFLLELRKHLAVLRQEGLVDTWTDHEIRAGEEIDPVILTALEKAELMLLLVSSSFFNSDYCMNREFAHALERQKKGEVIIVPIIVRYCDWIGSKVGPFMALPKDGKPISGRDWHNQDEAFLNVVKGLRIRLEEARDKRTALLAAVSLPSESSPTTATDPTELTRLGDRLTPVQVLTIENGLSRDPNQMAQRVRLLGYYFRRRVMQADAMDAAQPHILWLIEHAPGSKAAGLPEAHIDQHIDPIHYEEAVHAWNRQIAEHPDDVKVLSNASAFLQLGNPKKAEELLLRVRQLEPENPVWAERLGRFYSLLSRRSSALHFPNAPTLALQFYEKALLETADEFKQFHIRTSLTEAAITAMSFDKAHASAEELLRVAANFRDDWNYGNALYTANSVLGMLSLQEEDVDAAEKYLLAAGDTPGSPQLNSFGPKLELAAELLKLGRRDAVIQFLEKISRFWKSRASRLAGWIDEIREGKNPQLKRFGR